MVTFFFVFVNYLTKIKGAFGIKTTNSQSNDSLIKLNTMTPLSVKNIIANAETLTCLVLSSFYHIH